MMRFGWNAKETSIRIRWLAKVAAIIFIVLYSVIYVSQPFSEIWNNIFANVFLVAASMFAAAVVSMVWACYDRSDAPRRVWGSFAVGLWLWVIAESVWGYLNVTRGEVPEGPADVFWVTSYFFLGRALFLQFQILVRPTARELWSRVLIALLFLLALNLLIYGVLSPASTAPGKLDVAVNSFYPAADLLLALVALWLASHFMGGAFARPWLGLLVFTFADLMYAWLEISGMYSWGIAQGNLLSTVADIIYLSAYLVLGLGALSQWVFLKYGLRSPT